MGTALPCLVHPRASLSDKHPRPVTKRAGGLSPELKDANGESGHPQVEEMKGG